MSYSIGFICFSDLFLLHFSSIQPLSRSFIRIPASVNHHPQEEKRTTHKGKPSTRQHRNRKTPLSSLTLYVINLSAISSFLHIHSPAFCRFLEDCIMAMPTVPLFQMARRYCHSCLALTEPHWPLAGKSLSQVPFSLLLFFLFLRI